MLVAESFPGMKLAIDAVDLDSEGVLSYAEAGVYTDLEVKRGLSHERRQRFCGKWEEHVSYQDRCVPDITFSQLNLASDWRRPSAVVGFLS